MLGKRVPRNVETAAASAGLQVHPGGLGRDDHRGQSTKPTAAAGSDGEQRRALEADADAAQRPAAGVDRVGRGRRAPPR